MILCDRGKTDDVENVTLLPVALGVIEKYKSHPYCKAFGKLLPVNSNQKFNAYLKEIADICGIKKKLTTHVARHTCATTVLLSNDVPLETTMELLGHRSIRTTQIMRGRQKKLSKNLIELRDRMAKI